jgi:DNA-binding transcriptional ArsR family regulator
MLIFLSVGKQSIVQSVKNDIHPLVAHSGGTDSMNADTDFLMTRDEEIERASRSLKAMSHPLRLKILCTLGSEEISVQEIVEQVGTSQSNISQHLAILREKGILTSRKDANRVYYRVGDARTLRLIRMIRDLFCSQD